MDTMANDRPAEETVRERTGKGWPEWLDVLDEFDCRAKGHTATAKWLEAEHGLTSWWAQTVTVQYERERGIREIGQRHDGKFALNVTRTIAAPVERVWNAFADEKEMSTWFTTGHRHDFREGGSYSNGDGDKGKYTKIAPQERLHFTWENEKHCPGSLVIVEFMPKGAEKTTVAITHEKLPDKAGVDDMKTGWSWALDCLKSYLETGKKIGYEEWLASRGT
jgi:uncharacterized protein YndB with AHSA1/START domain